MLSLDLTGKRAFVAGVGDDRGYGWAICKALATAGASVCVGTWPPILNIFRKSLERGKLDMALPGGGELELERVYPLDAVFDTPDDVPADIREDKRYKDLEAFTIQETADAMRGDFGEPCLDVLVHSLANGPEVQKDLLDTSRHGYLAAVGASAYSMVSLVQRFGPLMREGAAVVSLTYLAAERAIPGYGGGMSSAKAALESDTRTLAFEAGRRWGIRVNTISAGPLASRAAKAIGKIDRMVEYYDQNSALGGANTAQDVGNAATFLCSPLASGIAGVTLYVDRGYHAMGMVAEPYLAADEG
ncbi:MAG: enoyl-[acyl-carrier-protein] reductase [Gemmatimonadetes bacterium]|nr:enoyl-[acyl-carrier-protein] reductase [Gemmatimonadota bacterium]